MSDETPELPPVSDEASDKKPKVVRKRGRVGSKKDLAGEVPPAAEPPVAQTGESHIEERTETRKTENGTVQRVSSKRVPGKGEGTQASPEPGGQPEVRPSGEGSPAAVEETIPLIKEPPAPENQSGSGKRRRRRRGKSGHDDSRDPSDQGSGPQPQRSQLDPDEVARKAWKIFLAEVSEEGLALINDNDAKEVSRRSFRLAEIFLEEAARRG